MTAIAAALNRVLDNAAPLDVDEPIHVSLHTGSAPDPHAPPVPLDRRYRDRITGISGIATAYTIYLYDTPSVRLTRLHNGKPDEVWLTAARLVPDDDPPPGTYA